MGVSGNGAKPRKALFYPYVPRDVEEAKTASPQRTAITGAAVYAGEVFKAILKYGTYDCVLLPATKRPPTGDVRDAVWFQHHAARIRFVEEHELAACREFAHLVVFTPGPNLHNLLRVRELCGGAAPIAGVIHSLNHVSQMRAVNEMLVSPLCAHDAVICSSSAGQRAFAAMFETAGRRLEATGLIGLKSPIRLPVIPLGVETSGFARSDRDRADQRRRWGCGEDDCVLLYLGRLGETTKADLYPLMLVFSQLVRRFPHAWLVLAGDDAYHHIAASLRAFADALPGGHRIRVVPNPSYDEKKRLYAASDVFVSPVDSMQETFGLTLVEAMSSSLPIVASDWSGYRDIVQPGETGVLTKTAMPCYPRGADHLRSSGSMNALDLIAATTAVDLKAFEQAVGGLIENRELRVRLGERARDRARSQFDWSVVVRRYESLFDELVAAARETANTPVNGVRSTEWFDYLEVFGHYATHVLDNASRVRITESGRSASDLPMLLERVAAPSSWFSADGLRSILAYCRDREDASIGEIAAACSSNGDANGDAEGHYMSAVCRLYKYGLLETCEASPANAENAESPASTTHATRATRATSGSEASR